MGEERDRADVRIAPPLWFIGCGVIGYLCERFVYPLTLPLDPTIRIAGSVICFVAAVALMSAAMGLFRKIDQDPKPWKPTPAIASTGVFAFTRNPMYVSMALIQVLLGLALASGWILLLLPLSLLAVYLEAIRHEEAYLERKFGEEYLEYKRSVRRWL